MIAGKKGVEWHHIQGKCVFSSGNLEGRRKEAREEPKHSCLALLQPCGNSVPQAHTLFRNQWTLFGPSVYLPILSVVGLPKPTRATILTRTQLLKHLLLLFRFSDLKQFNWIIFSTVVLGDRIVLAHLTHLCPSQLAPSASQSVTELSFAVYFSFLLSVAFQFLRFCCTVTGVSKSSTVLIG